MSLYRVPAAMLEALGEAYTIRRGTAAAGVNTWTQGTVTVAYYAQRGQRRIDRPNDAGGLVRDSQSVIILSPDYTAPIQGDMVAPGTHVADGSVEWMEIVHVDTVRVEGQIAKYHAWIRD